MQQAIIQILDDIAKESMETFRETNAKDIYPTWISTAKDRISALWDGWIKIWDECPEDNTEVLVIDDEWIDISQWFASEHSWTWLWLHSRRKFTHWMPLPLPPK